LSIPYFPLYPTDYEADTAHLTLEEDGAYNRLLRLMWVTPGCSVPDDSAWIARRMRVDMVTFLRLVEPVIDEFCKRIGGRVLSPRLQREWEKIAETSRKHSDAAKKRWNMQGAEIAQKTVMPSISQADARHMQPEPYPEPYPTGKKEGASAQNLQNDVRLEIEAWASPAAAASFIAYRKKAKGKALTITAAKRLATHLKTIFDRGGDPDDALGLAEERGWQTVEADWYFNAKGNGNGQRNHHGGNAATESRDRFLDEIAEVARARPTPRLVGG
jgi:uncharacterized protein YdaU (DUF1376 family)